MLRRFSSTFNKKKGDREPKQNGVATTTTTTTPTTNKRYSKVPEGHKSSSEEERNEKKGGAVSPFEKYASVLHASRTPIPNQTGDGAYLEHEHTTSLLQDARHLGFKDLATLKEVIKNKATGQLVDDKTMLMERVIQLVSSLPHNSKHREELTHSFLDELWGSLPHPPLSYMGSEYAYRSADGSNNNPTLPWLGAANTAYARTIAPLIIQPGGLPDPGLVFDTLFARQSFKPHPNNVSSLFFDWASLIIHDIFQTDYRNPHVNKTSGYLDLSILYGDVQEEQNLIRTFEGGRLKTDSFSEPRLQAFPAACCVLLVMLNRFHNHVVEQLAAINENGRFTQPRDGLPEDQAKKAWEKYDEDLFQTGRLITCGLYINITLYDYLRTIVNLNRTNSTWCLDPRAQMEGNNTTPSGLGNQCSVEFNLAYRWHSAISANDEKWTEKIYEDLMGKPASEVSMTELLMGLGKYEAGLSKDPSQRTFAGLERQADGRFRDEDLVNILTGAIEDVAGSFGARNVPKVLKNVEVLGILQSRKWNVGSLNEFRKFFGLKPYETFEEINSDPDVAESLRSLYDHPDFVELYPGIVSEEAKEPMIPGVGIAPTYTISRAVLSDAVALVRGDRYYTIDYNARNLTNWGYSEVRYDLSINQGCVFYKLATRAFPDWFKSDSIYAHYPMTIPSENRKIMKNLGREAHYSYDRPQYIPPPVDLLSYPSAKLVAEQRKDFHTVWADTVEFVFGKASKNFKLSEDTAFIERQRETISKLLSQDEWQRNVKEFYEEITTGLLEEKTRRFAGINQVDITRDIGNLVPVIFASNLFSLPLRSKENSRGIFTEHEMFNVLAVLYNCIYFDIDKTKSFPLHHASQAVGEQLGKAVEANVKSLGGSSLLSGILGGSRDNKNALKEYGAHMTKQLLENGLGASEITWSQILPTVIAMVPSQAQAFTQIIDFYLSKEGSKYLPEIQRLAREESKESDEQLLRYCMEAIRLNKTSGAYREARTSLTVTEETGQVTLQPGDKVFVGFAKANRDPSVFPDPSEVRLDRPLDAYINHSLGPHGFLSKETSQIALTAMLRAVGRLNNLRRAPGAQGEVKKVPIADGYSAYLREDHGSYSVFPTTFRVHYDV
ncbi:peroxidase/cytochrome P450 family protein [Aspergillus clavatus NRRL 1]|uniref:Animal haem peroxidase family protein n=1 Tax=Aspergillus clavatus (strain ATCC 1007 / CBS 513.65 / DSM 816 / NCTC 3887 / NRRL 1 / QM 1276 / 107) TaxID=344612 RepID=A1CKV8_ASPCL|nr:uncharacterized protein ACLA_039980 [Aspergillus clavatus NRRL 1]EAW09782.1 animal haem peroxidase family protein [Aspergillus clavatus NRRL 1]